LTGLFLCLFLIVHLLGNTQLLLPADEAIGKFNGYSKFMTGNPIIKIVSYALYASIVLHAVYALVITLQNRQSSGGQYAYDQREKTSKWYSRNMGLLGAVLLLYLVIHMKDFWYQYKWGNIPLDEAGNKDLYTIVVEAYGQWWYVLLNVLAFVALGYHLLHGFFSAFKSLGAYPPRLSKLLYFFSVGLTVLLTAGFIVIPIYVYFKFHS
ncbi:MAG: succinate dehydrogenase cytochrome b subunit, partial [Bacteroidota bacterium]